MEPEGISPSAPGWALGVLMHEPNGGTPAWPVADCPPRQSAESFANWSVSYQAGFLLFTLKHRFLPFGCQTLSAALSAGSWMPGPGDFICHLRCHRLLSAWFLHALRA